MQSQKNKNKPYRFLTARQKRRRLNILLSDNVEPSFVQEQEPRNYVLKDHDNSNQNFQLTSLIPLPDDDSGSSSTAVITVHPSVENCYKHSQISGSNNIGSRGDISQKPHSESKVELLRGAHSLENQTFFYTDDSDTSSGDEDFLNPKNINNLLNHPPNTSTSTLQDDLQEWFIESNISKAQANKLLVILNKHGISLPKDSRTVLKTPRQIPLTEISPGYYIHFGLKNALSRSISTYYSDSDIPSQILINVNVDGLPISKSSGSQLWPILGSIVDREFYTQPFEIGIYHGYKKPDNPNDFLKLFVEEMKLIQEEGFIYKNTKIFISLNAICCDAPARAYITCTKNHTGYSGCSRCIQEGEYYLNRVIFPELHSNVRSDDSFHRRLDEDHHKGDSILESLGIGMVSQVVLDYMHLVCLGVVKKLISFWVHRNITVRLSKDKISLVNQRLSSNKVNITAEFARKPRPLEEIDRWKATELRQFLLYTGVVVLKDILRLSYYQHFLSLSIAINIFLAQDNVKDPNELARQLEYGKDLIYYFVRIYKDLYGKENMSYNVHNLLHLYDDAKKNGSLDNISKQQIKASSKPLQQIYNRVSERNQILEKVIKPSTNSSFLLENSFYNQNNFEFFKNIKFKNFVLSTEEPNNYCLIDKNVLEINCIKFNCLNKRTYFSGICVVDSSQYEIMENWEVTITNIKKCLKLQLFDNNMENYILMPLIHT